MPTPDNVDPNSCILNCDAGKPAPTVTQAPPTATQAPAPTVTQAPPTGQQGVPTRGTEPGTDDSATTDTNEYAKKPGNGEDMDSEVCRVAREAVNKGASKMSDVPNANLFYNSGNSLRGSNLYVYGSPTPNPATPAQGSVDINPYASEIRNAMGMWNGASRNGRGIGVTLATNGNPTLKILTDTGGLDSKEFANREPGVTWAKYNAGRGVIVLNDWAFKQAELSSEQIAAVVAHELGHAMGLGHGCAGRVMRGDYSAQVPPYAPTPFDVAILQLAH